MGPRPLAALARGRLSTECTTGTDFATNAQITFLAPLIVLVGIAAFWMLYAWVVERESVLSNWTLARVQLSTLVALITMHPTLTKTVFQFYQCTDEIAGKSLLIADASIVCFEEEHLRLTYSLAVPAIFFYVVGIPGTLWACGSCESWS